MLLKPGLGQADTFPVPATAGGELVWVLGALVGFMWLAEQVVGGSRNASGDSRTSRRTSWSHRGSRAGVASRALAPGLVSDLASTLRNQGLSASSAKAVARRAARSHPGNFDAALREAIRLAR